MWVVWKASSKEEAMQMTASYEISLQHERETAKLTLERIVLNALVPQQTVTSLEMTRHLL
jgi:hypothetical protein